MLALDHHIASRIHEDERRMARVGLHEPDDDRYVVSNILKYHRNCAVRLEKVDGAAVVVGKRGGFRLERGVGFGEREEVLTDEPLHVFRVRKGRWAALGKDGAEKLLSILSH